MCVSSDNRFVQNVQTTVSARLIHFRIKCHLAIIKNEPTNGLILPRFEIFFCFEKPKINSIKRNKFRLNVLQLRIALRHRHRVSQSANERRTHFGHNTIFSATIQFTSTISIRPYHRSLSYRSQQSTAYDAAYKSLLKETNKAHLWQANPRPNMLPV